jgi:hypothetical protein
MKGDFKMVRQFLRIYEGHKPSRSANQIIQESVDRRDNDARSNGK